MSAVPSRLRGEQLTLAYGNKTIAESLNVTIPDGHFTAIIGPNGCGKSTLLRTLSRLMTPASGHVWLDGAQIQQYASKEVARRIGLLAQNATTPGDITVQELVARGRYPHQPLFTRWRKEDEEAVNKAMRATGISDLALQSVDTLSGGQRRRIELARILFSDADTLILDEPTNHLDMRSKDVLKDALKEFDGTVIVVSHDREFLDGLVDKVYEFGNKRVIEHLGGIYDFLEHKKMDSLCELERSTQTTTSMEGNASEPTRNKLSYEARKEQSKAIKKVEKAIAESEKKITELENSIAAIEAKLATPEGAADVSLYTEYSELKKKLSDTMDLWTEQTLELEELNAANS